jgi:carbonic anhydrase
VDKLIRGLVRFREHELPKRRALFEELARGQSPDTLFLTCADSRVDPNLLVQGEPGDLFTIRTVGNLIAPAASDGGALGDVSEAAAVEYALLALDVKDVVICGHSLCGAMSAIVDGLEVPGAPNLIEWLAHGTPSLERVLRAEHIDHGLPLAEQLSQVNVLQQLDHLRSYPVVRDRERAGEIRLHGWWFDVATGNTHIYDLERGGFVLLDAEEADRILRHAVPAPRLTFVP